MSNPIDEAITALRHGDQATAFTLLRTRLAQEPKDATAWLWMSEATPDIRRKVEALTRFLALAPNHAHAPSVRLRLQQLKGQMEGEYQPAEAMRGDIFGDDATAFTGIEQSGALRPLVPPPARSENTPSLRDRVATSPQPMIQDDDELPTIEPAIPPSTIPASVFTPRPAAPPPPNFKPLHADNDEDEGLPIWVWGLMGLAIVLVILFIYLIFNFERMAVLFQ